MSDLEAIKKILNDTGIVYELGGDTEDYFCLTVEAKKSDKNLGYTHFWSELLFDKEGKLVSWGVWE